MAAGRNGTLRVRASSQAPAGRLRYVLTPARPGLSLPVMADPRPRRRWPKILGIVALVLVALLVVGSLVLDRVLTSQARKQADALAARLGRPVTIGAISTKLLTGFGVRVTGVGIGAGPGEGAPLLELERAEVRVGLLRVLFSGGKSLLVHEAVVSGLRVNVIKLPDGTTNAERVADALAKEEGPAKKEEAPPEAGPSQKQPALRSLRVDRAAVENARIAFLDRTVPGTKELFVDDLDVEVRDLETGRPLEVVVRAAVLATRQNLELRVKAAPLPDTLQPTPEELVLKVEPIDLGPLAPFLPKTVAFRGGQFQADLAAKLGAAVPGGSGKTTVKGGFRATGLAFAGQEGGRKLDVVLDSDLDADAKAGDLRIGKLDLTAGPVTLTGKGSASGLTGDAPRFDGLEIVAKGLDPEALAAYYPPLRKQMGGAEVAGPIGLTVRGSGTASAQTAELRVDLTPVRLAVPHELSKAAGAPMTFVARADAAHGGGEVRFDAKADLAGVDLRPGGSIAKKPGDPMALDVRGTYRKTGGGEAIRVDALDANVLGDRLTGKAAVDVSGTGPKATTRFDASLRGDRLDLDRILLPSEKTEAEKEKAKAKESKPLDPKAFAGLSGTASLDLGVLRMKKLDMRNVTVRMKVQGDEVTFEQARLDAFGGSVSAAGTKLAVARPEAPFEVALDLKNVGAEDALKLLGDHRVLSGTLDGAVKLGGSGWKLGLLGKSATGDVQGLLKDGAFYGKDLVASVVKPLQGKLPFASGKLSEGGKTALGKALPFDFSIANGLAKLKKPLTADTGEGTLALDGGVRLDGVLEMPATFALSPELVSRITGGRAKPSGPIPVTFRLAGPAWSPRVEALSLDAAAKTIASQMASGALGRIVGAPGGNVDEAAKQKQAEAEAKAKQEADAQRKKLEESAKKRLKGLFGQ
jgi:AsmA protein